MHWLKWKTEHVLFQTHEADFYILTVFFCCCCCCRRYSVSSIFIFRIFFWTHVIGCLCSVHVSLVWQNGKILLFLFFRTSFFFPLKVHTLAMNKQIPKYFIQNGRECRPDDTWQNPYPPQSQRYCISFRIFFVPQIYPLEMCLFDRWLISIFTGNHLIATCFIAPFFSSNLMGFMLNVRVCVCVTFYLADILMPT